MGHSNGVDLVEGDTRVEQRPFQGGLHVPDVLPGSEFGNHSAMWSVQDRLRRDDIGAQPPAILNDAHGGFITRGFDAKNEHFLLEQGSVVREHIKADL